MRESKNLRMILPDRWRPSLSSVGRKSDGPVEHLCWFLLCIMTTAILIGGCSPLNGGSQARSAFEEADVLSSQGSYQAALDKYAQIIEMYPASGDRVLFEMGIIHSHPKNELKDYERSLECFYKLIKDYPASEYRHDSEMMIFYINNIYANNKTLAKKQTQIDSLKQDFISKNHEIVTLKKTIEDLEQKIFAFAIKLGPVEKILVEKKERRLMLISNGTVIKTYKISLGGNPAGPKERQGDNKTPEGIYFIDAKNMDSRYHLSLHISYPNEKDKQRAKELGVSPGGDVMIHGIKNGFSWVGDAHTEADWTRGCIAVTDKEIEEINTFAPIGTTVEIRP